MLGVVGPASLLAKKRATPRSVIVPVVATIGMAIFSYRLENMVDWRLTIFGLMTLFVVYYLQDGIVGFLREPAGHGACTHARGGRPTRRPTPFAGAARRERAAASLLKAQQILMQFGGLKALNLVDLNVARGSVHGLIGPNGSGKSTMMNVLTGIYKPTAGDVAFDGALITGRTPSADRAGRRCAHLPERAAVRRDDGHRERAGRPAPHLPLATCWTSMLHTPRYRREERAARERAASILEFVGLATLADEEARNLPYGKQRLLEIGRALALESATAAARRAGRRPDGAGHQAS